MADVLSFASSTSSACVERIFRAKAYIVPDFRVRSRAKTSGLPTRLDTIRATEKLGVHTVLVTCKPPAPAGCPPAPPTVELPPLQGSSASRGLVPNRIYVKGLSRAGSKPQASHSASKQYSIGSVVDGSGGRTSEGHRVFAASNDRV